MQESCYNESPAAHKKDTSVGREFHLRTMNASIRNAVTVLISSVLLVVSASALPANPRLSPSLLFDTTELSSLRAKVRDGGPDDDAYQYIRQLVTVEYPGRTLTDHLDVIYGMQFPLNLAIAAYLEDPIDEMLLEQGRTLVLELAGTQGPDQNVFLTAIRLRILAMGYDFFFTNASRADREIVKEEILGYVDYIIDDMTFQRWLFRPYLSNISAMTGAALGFAALALADELADGEMERIFARSDEYIIAWMTHQLDPDGAYNEGAMYAGWSLRHLAPYFWARERYDGYDYSKLGGIRDIEDWLAFAMLPLPGGLVNNVNDTSSFNRPLARFNTYFDWAQATWNSGLSRWLWNRYSAPPYGTEAGELADQAATVLWHRPIAPVNPSLVLPKRMLWKHRGLYYFRTGWSASPSPNDVSFSFYSGKFHGGHAHEDQNNFTLYGYGAGFAVDNGFEPYNRENVAHNMVFVDGVGQHHVGGSIGTDGIISESLFSGVADYLVGDATEAYTTHSEFNEPDVPFPGDDWSWGYLHANPVERATRMCMVIHGDPTPPYVLLVDDIAKDATTRTYDWRMHTPDTNTLSVDDWPLRIYTEEAELTIHSLFSPRPDVTVTPYDNQLEDPSTNILTLRRVGTSAQFALLMVPRELHRPGAIVEPIPESWGGVFRVAWRGTVDYLVVNPEMHDVNWVEDPLRQGVSSLALRTDASVLLVRTVNSAVDSWMAANASYARANGQLVAQVGNGRTTMAMSGDELHISDPASEFNAYGPRVKQVWANDERVAFRYRGGYVSSFESSSTISAPPLLQVQAFPNPFQSEVRLVVESERDATIDVNVYDVAGRLVTRVFSGMMAPGSKVFDWRGDDGDGARVASGVYYVVVHSQGNVTSTPVVLVR